VLGLLGSSRAVAGLVERRGCAASRRVAVVVLLLMVVMTVVAVAVQLAIPLLPLDLLVSFIGGADLSAEIFLHDCMQHNPIRNRTYFYLPLSQEQHTKSS